MYVAWPPLAIAALCAITFSHIWTRVLRDHAHCLAWLGIYILVTLPLLCLAFRWLWYGHVDRTLAEALLRTLRALALGLKSVCRLLHDCFPFHVQDYKAQESNICSFTFPRSYCNRICFGGCILRIIGLSK